MGIVIAGAKTVPIEGATQHLIYGKLELATTQSMQRERKYIDGVRMRKNKQSRLF